MFGERAERAKLIDIATSRHKAKADALASEICVICAIPPINDHAIEKYIATRILRYGDEREKEVLRRVKS